MRRPVLLLACLLLLVTGMALLGFAQAAYPPARPPESVMILDNVEPARAFYAAVNDLLASGDTGALDDVIVPDFVEHPARPGARGQAGFIQGLVAQRAMFHELRVVVDDIRAAGADQVVVRVHAVGGQIGTFLGRPAPADQAVWGPVELLRIVAGRVVERWHTARMAISLDPLWQAPFPGGSPEVAATVVMRRLTWAPGSELVVTTNPAAWVVLVERGRLVVASETAASAPSGLVPDVVLVPGEHANVPPKVAFAIRNHGTETATAFVIAAWTPYMLTSMIAAGAGSWLAEGTVNALGLNWDASGELVLAPGVVSRVVTSATGVEIPPGKTLAVGRVVLAPDTSLDLAVGGPLVLAVDAGRIGLGTGGSVVHAIGRSGRTRAVVGSAEIVTGEGVVTTGEAVTLRQIGEEVSVILVLAIIPAPN